MDDFSKKNEHEKLVKYQKVKFQLGQIKIARIPTLKKTIKLV